MTPLLRPSSAARRLVAWLAETAPKRLLILTHDHPDPDALASAWALSLVAQKVARTRVRIAYGGIVGRRENRTMLESLEVPAYPLRPGDLDDGAVALVDTQPPFRNNRFPFPKRRRPDIVVDHHPKSPDTVARLTIIDTTVGATTTLLAEALLAAGVKVPRRLATAIVYGIGSETQNLGRETSPRDAAAYTTFLPKADLNVLWRISNPRRPASFFSHLARGIRGAFVWRDVIGVHLRELPTPDRVAQMADFLLTHERMRWSVVTGRYDGRLHVSLRTSSETTHAGRTLKALLGGGHRAGGHRMIAGGSLEVGHGVPERVWRRAEDGVARAFLRTRGAAAGARPEHPFREA
ncbi:MAG: DHH family phosphoesterase [Elusimicrobia bacterium]|nr:DHH family phosphoesterase [Elusimicrobiota bacterium]